MNPYQDYDQMHGNAYAEKVKKASEKQKIKTIFNMTWVLKPSESGD